MNKKGQGLSLNVIIVAALALIVLVVLVAVFTGRIAIFQDSIGGEAKSELNALKSFYGRCHPGALAEATFITDYTTAGKLDNLQEAAQGKALSKGVFQSEIDNCRNFADKSSCDSGGCGWS
jgi:hypothetical protein